MIIHKTGDPKRLIPWWESRVWVCPRCGAEFSPTESKEVRLWDGHQLEPSDPDTFAACDCPTCGVAVSTRDDREDYW